MDSDVCPDEAAVETSAFDDVFVSQIDLYPLGGGGGGVKNRHQRWRKYKNVHVVCLHEDNIVAVPDRK